MFTVKELEKSPTLRALVRLKLQNVGEFSEGDYFTMRSPENNAYMGIYYFKCRLENTIAVDEPSTITAINIDTKKHALILDDVKVRHYTPTEEEKLSLIPYIT